MEWEQGETPAARARCCAIGRDCGSIWNCLRALVVVPCLISACVVDQGGGAGEGDDTGSPSQDASSTITFRQFSSGPSLARGQGSSDPQSPNYGALRIFVERAEARTDALGPGKRVAFSLATGPASFADVANNSYQAAHLSGGALNSVWGFLYNSVPFGPSFEQMIDFLHNGDGVRLANQIYEERDVDAVAFPVVGSPAQGSGYFKKPVGSPECPQVGDEECQSYRDGIGLNGLCSEPWTLRYLPPAETVLDLACDGFDTPQRVDFVQAIPGGSAFLTAIQQGIIEGFEFATPVDDYDAEWGGFFANPEVPEDSDGRNVGEVGLRFLHYPAWHQPFFLGWMVINRSQVWDNLDPDQQGAIEEAAREAVVDSFNASSSVQCEFLRRTLDINDGRNQLGAAGEGLDSSANMILTRWNTEDLARLRDATDYLLADVGAAPSPTNAEADYNTIKSALLEHLDYGSIAEMLDAWTEAASPPPGGCTRRL